MTAKTSVVGLFAGIGGFELGFRRKGFEAELFVDNSEIAQAVLRARFTGIRLVGDVRDLRSLPRDCGIVLAGFPCQDLSSVGMKSGIRGARSFLVAEVFRLLARRSVDWVVLENVPFLLQLDGGAALTFITRSLSRLGYAWAYRVVDAQAFGRPQRRKRWYLVASKHQDPRSVLLADDGDPRHLEQGGERANGFYWTEGTRALGWAPDGVPPLKGGSTIGVPSPPAIVFPDGFIGTPDIRDAERLQGFPANWTRPAERVARPGHRWLLIGNAVSVDVSTWLASRIARPARYDASSDERWRHGPWPDAAWSEESGRVFVSQASPYPAGRRYQHLEQFLSHPTRPLSVRAAAGFLSRAENAKLRFPPGFLDAVRAHIRRQKRIAA